MTISKPFCVIIVLLSLLVGCDGADFTRSGDSLLANRSTSSRGDGRAFAQEVVTALGGRSPERRVTGSDKFLSDSGASSAPLISTSDQGDFTLNLVNVPLENAASAVLGEALKRNYTITPGLTGTVTLQTTRGLSERELLETFEAVLELNGATLQSRNGLISVVPVSGSTARVETRNSQTGFGARVVAVPLQYIGTAEMIRLLEPIAGESLRFQQIPNRNVILIAGRREEINAAIDAVNLFDVDVLKGKSVGLFRLRAAEPEAVVEELKLIFESEEGGSLQNVITFVPSQRLSAVIVVTSRSRYLSRAERWIRDLDRTAGGVKRRPVVYNLEHRSAEDLVPTLGEMLQDIASEEQIASEGAPRVAADKHQNAIIVWGNDTEQESMARLLQRLDTVPVQVLLEATIAEVSLTDELNFGLKWFFENRGLNTTFSNSPNGSVAQTFPGLSLLFQGGSVTSALNALSSITDVQVVSSPSLMVLDNQEATLQIGDQVPIATQQVRSTENENAPIVSTISFRDTGIILRVKPRVSRTGQIILEINQEVSKVSNTTTSGIDSPTISQRRIETSIAVSDGQTIALGGLIEDSRNRNTSQVPGAGDIPLLGALFRNRSDSVGRTELLIMVTPRVIRDGEESRAITQELRVRISGADGLVRNGITTPSVGHRILH